MNQFEKKISALMIIKNCGDDGITQGEILSIAKFYSQSGLSMTLTALSDCGYVTKIKERKAGKGCYGCSIRYKLTEKGKFIFGVQ